jgi:hypothetical protein
VKRRDDGGRQTRSAVTLPADLEALVTRLMARSHLSRSAAVVEVMWTGAATLRTRRTAARGSPASPILTTEWLAGVHSYRDKIVASAAQGRPLGYSSAAAATLPYGPGRGHAARQTFGGARNATDKATAAFQALEELTMARQLIAFPCTPEIAYRAAAIRQAVDANMTPKQLPGREYVISRLFDAVAVVTASLTGNPVVAADRQDIIYLIDELPPADRPERMYPGDFGFVHVRVPLSSR